MSRVPHRLLSKTDSFTLLLFNPNLPVCCCCCCLPSDDNGQYEVRCRSLIHVNIPQEEMENQGKPKKRNLRTYVYISWSNFFFFRICADPVLSHGHRVGASGPHPRLQRALEESHAGARCGGFADVYSTWPVFFFGVFERWAVEPAVLLVQYSDWVLR